VRRPVPYSKRAFPRPEMLETMAEPAGLLALGKTQPEVAEQLGLKQGAMDYWQHRYAAQWRAIRRQAFAVAERIAKVQAPALLPPPRLRDKPGLEIPDERPSPEWPLTRFYRQWVRHTLSIRAGSATDKDYLIALRLWSDVTGNPPIDKITVATCSAFMDAARNRRTPKGKPVSGSTVRRYWGCISRVLARAGPPPSARPMGAD
jgi:hypothetical protein